MIFEVVFWDATVIVSLVPVVVVLLVLMVGSVVFVTLDVALALILIVVLVMVLVASPSTKFSKSSKASSSKPSKSSKASPSKPSSVPDSTDSTDCPVVLPNIVNNSINSLIYELFDTQFVISILNDIVLSDIVRFSFITVLGTNSQLDVRNTLMRHHLLSL